MTRKRRILIIQKSNTASTSHSNSLDSFGALEVSNCAGLYVFKIEAPRAQEKIHNQSKYKLLHGIVKNNINISIFISRSTNLLDFLVLEQHYPKILGDLPIFTVLYSLLCVFRTDKARYKSPC